MYIAFGRQHICTFIISGHFVNSILIILLEKRIQFLIIFAVTLWVDGELLQVVVICQFKQNDAHRLDINEVVIVLQLELRNKIANCANCVWLRL